MSYKDREKQKEYQREWLKRRRLEWLGKNGPCIFCGSDEGLEVDHCDPQEKISHNVWSWSEKRREKELKKCQVLCSICHRRKTNDQISILSPIPNLFWCSSCKDFISPEEFYSDKYKGRGLGSYCIKCSSLYHKNKAKGA